MADTPPDDHTIDGYQIVSTIAMGGTSQVLEVLEPGTSRRLAMKLLNTKHPDYAEHKTGLRHESKVLKLLEHPCIIHYEAFTAGRDHTYMLMEYFRAPNVKLQLMSNRNSVHMRLRKMLESVCSALQHVHEKGWVHRDLKPDNVLMNKVGEVKLIDFSLAVKPQGALSKLVGGKVASIQGTRTYLAPETIRKKPATFQTDLYSLGVMIFEVLTGKTPFQAPTPDELLQKHLTSKPPAPSEFNPNVTPDMDRLVLKLLSKKPDQRGKDIGEIAGELRRITIFKEEPKEESKEMSADQNSSQFLEELQAAKLDSRLDAKRSEMIKQNPELGRQIIEQEEARRKELAAKKARRLEQLAKKGKGGTSAPATQPQQPPPPQYPPQPMPGMAPYPMPPMPYGMPPAGYPGMPPAGYPGMPPGYPPGVPMMPPGVMPPGAMMPGMPMAPGAPPMPGMPPMPVAPAAPQQPAAPQAAPQQPARAAAPAAKPPAAKPPAPAPTPSDDDLEYMTELPEVL